MADEGQGAIWRDTADGRYRARVADVQYDSLHFETIAVLDESDVVPFELQLPGTWDPNESDAITVVDSRSPRGAADPVAESDDSMGRSAIGAALKRSLQRPDDD